MSDKIKKLKEQFDNYKYETDKRKPSDLEKMLDMPVKIPKLGEVNKMLKATGVVRKVDQLGRVVLPVEIRRTRKIEEGTPMEIFVDDKGGIVFKKYEPSCCFCGNAEDLVDNHGKKVCKTCVDKLQKVCS